MHSNFHVCFTSQSTLSYSYVFIQIIASGSYLIQDRDLLHTPTHSVRVLGTHSNYHTSLQIMPPIRILMYLFKSLHLVPTWFKILTFFVHQPTELPSYVCIQIITPVPPVQQVNPLIHILRYSSNYSIRFMRDRICWPPSYSSSLYQVMYTMKLSHLLHQSIHPFIFLGTDFNYCTCFVYKHSNYQAYFTSQPIIIILIDIHPNYCTYFLSDPVSWLLSWTNPVIQVVMYAYKLPHLLHSVTSDIAGMIWGSDDSWQDDEHNDIVLVEIIIFVM